MKEQLKYNQLLKPDQTNKNLVNSAFVDGLVKFVKGGTFMNAQKDKGQKTIKYKTKPEMAKHPRIQLSLPTLNPFSQKYKKELDDMRKKPKTLEPSASLMERVGDSVKSVSANQ